MLAAGLYREGGGIAEQRQRGGRVAANQCEPALQLRHRRHGRTFPPQCCESRGSRDRVLEDVEPSQPEANGEGFVALRQRSRQLVPRSRRVLVQHRFALLGEQASQMRPARRIARRKP